MNDSAQRLIADQLSIIVRVLEVQNEHLGSIAHRLESIEDAATYIGQSVASLIPDEE